MSNEPADNPGTFAELMALINRGGRWWMAPLIAAVVLVAGAMVFLHAVEYVAPFVYIAR
ncbi:MAG: DUF5989 family protein [Myxococcota bacterium]|jgi:hypothetical protein